MSLEWNYTTGDFAAVRASINRALGQYSVRAGSIKVGRTNSPERRYGEHQRARREAGEKPWDRMIVLHESSSFAEIVKAEALAIDWLRSRARGKADADWLVNVRGGDLVATGEEHFVYLLLDSRTTIETPKPEPDWLYSTGHTRDVMTGLRQALAAYAQRNDFLKIGRTNDPARRWKEHLAERRREDDKWDRMVVIYATSSLHSAALVEKELIRHARAAKYRAELWNEASGSDNGRPGTNYLYLLVA